MEGKENLRFIIFIGQCDSSSIYSDQAAAAAAAVRLALAPTLATEMKKRKSEVEAQLSNNVAATVEFLQRSNYINLAATFCYMTSIILQVKKR